MVPQKAQSADSANVVWIPLMLRLQHGLLILSVLFLCVSGFALHFHDSRIGAWFIGLEGGFTARGMIHRVAALGLTAVLAWHFVYVVFTDAGHRELMRLLPRAKDLRDFVSQLKMNLGLASAAPSLDRYGYREKFQYWSVAILTIMMIATGFLLWFGSEAMRLFPKFVLDLIRIFHGSEATFALVAIFLWHVYNVHLAPGRVTGWETAITGRVALESVKRRHPAELERILKERNQP